MNLVQKIMGRRQFLIAAGVTSTSALAYNRLAGNPGFQAGNAMAAEKAASALAAGASGKYSHLFSPIKAGTQILKSRMYFTHATPHFLQGPENYPGIPVRDFYIDLAKSGAAIITTRLITNRVRAEQRGDSAHMVIYDFDDAGVQNYLDQMTEAMNMYNTKAAFDLQFGAQVNMQQMMQQMMAAQGGAQGQAGAQGGQMPSGAQGAAGGQGGMPGMTGMSMSGGMPTGAQGAAGGQGQAGAQGGQMPSGAQGAAAGQGGMQGMTGMSMSGGMPTETEMTDEELQKNIDTMLTSATFYKNHGFGVAITRSATSKSSIAAIKALKKAWPDVIIMSRLSATKTVEDAVNSAKALEGMVDILTVQEDTSKSHCLSYNSEEDNPGTLKFVEAIKKAGVKIVIAPNGGYGDLAKNEEYIATGKCDMIAMGRAFIADPEYAKQAYEGRAEDVVP
ncbi:MAG: hypothetical protein LUQ59_12585, partial [Methanothrix sp.]|nr:hypothetical protein [Methanothrix sp.]